MVLILFVIDQTRLRVQAWRVPGHTSSLGGALRASSKLVLCRQISQKKITPSRTPVPKPLFRC